MRKARYLLLGAILAAGLAFVGCEDNGDNGDTEDGLAPTGTTTPLGGAS